MPASSGHRVTEHLSVAFAYRRDGHSANNRNAAATTPGWTTSSPGYCLVSCSRGVSVPSSHDEAAFSILERHQAAYCVISGETCRASCGGYTAPFVYLRLP